MTDDIPDYSAVEAPDGTPPEAYSYHQRRAEIFDSIVAAGSPTAVNQRDLADRYDVAPSTISNDMDRLRESVAEHLGTEAKFTTRTLYQHIVDDLLDADDWKAKKAAWDVVMDWNDWLGEIGAQHREPDRLDVSADVRRSEVQYRVVRDAAPELPADDTGDGVDYEALGFTAAPSGPVDVEAVDDIEEGAADE